MESVGGGEASPSRFNHAMPNEEDSVDPTDPGAANDEASTWSSLGLDDLPNPRNNVRVRSQVEQREMDAQAEVDSNRQPRLTDEEAASGDTDDHGTGLQNMVPDRVFIKLSSSRQHSEMLRKQESDARKKKMQERLEAADEADRKNT